jgi:hypothetical protein
MADDMVPFMASAEVMTSPLRFRLCDGGEIHVDPSSMESLITAEAAVRAAMRRMGPVDGRIMFTVARRQLADIRATKEAMITA